jgi:uncharacterized membrane protein
MTNSGYNPLDVAMSQLNLALRAIAGSDDEVSVHTQIQVGLLAAQVDIALRMGEIAQAIEARLMST